MSNPTESASHHRRREAGAREIERTMIAKTIAMACIACGGLVARAAAEVPPHEARGLYAIWYQAQREYLLDLPFIRGGQVFCQWAEVEAREGEYD